jgi:cell division septal protein FtsQ
MAGPTRQGRGHDWRAAKAICIALALALAVTTLVVVGQRTLAAISSSPFFDLSEIVVQGTCLVDEGEISAFLRPLIGRSVFSLNLWLVARTVETHPVVKRTTVRRLLPHSVAVTIEERQPLALLVLDERPYGIDEEGVLLPPFEPSVQPNLPLLSGWQANPADGPPRIGESLSSESIAAAIRFLKEVEAFDPLMVFEISEVRMDESASVTFYLAEQGIKVVVGKGDFPEKIAGLKAVLSELGANLGAVRYIDLRFQGQVVVGQRPARTPSGTG